MYDFQRIFELSLKARIYNLCQRTPLQLLTNISAKQNNQFYLKREDLQPTHSFKIRGAYNKIQNCTDDELKNGVVTASAGNHAQGVALSAQLRKIKAQIFMPIYTPQIKVDAVMSYGADVQLIGNSLRESLTYARNSCLKSGAIYIEGFNDPLVVAGQGTIGLEIIQDCPHLPDYIFAPIGGGGLISGIALIVKKIYPQIKIIGVEPEDSNCMTQSIINKQIQELEFVNSFAEGVAVSKPGELNFACCQEFVDDYINVSSDEICFAIKIIHDDLRAIAEPSGALSLAGAINYCKKKQLSRQTIVTINSGSNVDFDRYRYVSERTKIGAGKEILYAVKLPEHPGTLKKFCLQILPDLKISEFSYRYYSHKDAHVLLGIEKSMPNCLQIINDRLADNNYTYYNMTNDELTKNHIKYMIGGHFQANYRERVFQFNFPDTPSTLFEFLKKINEKWNISLLHYRSYGIDYIKIFLGVMIDEQNEQELIIFFNSLNYTYFEETNNISYKMFLDNSNS